MAEAAAHHLPTLAMLYFLPQLTTTRSVKVQLIIMTLHGDGGTKIYGYYNSRALFLKLSHPFFFSFMSTGSHQSVRDISFLVVSWESVR